MNETRLNAAIAFMLVALAVALRLLPHPANFAPVAAIALFGGAVLPRKLAVWVPLAAMMISDLIIGFYDIMPIIWLCYALIALASSLWLRKPTLVRGAVLTLGSSVFFFIVTNFAVWAAGTMYAHTWAGLMQCYALALPFFRDTFLSDAGYTLILFGSWPLARLLALKLQPALTRAAK